MMTTATILSVDEADQIARRYGCRVQLVDEFEHDGDLWWVWTDGQCEGHGEMDEDSLHEVLREMVR
jgi:hypothetical protein